VTTSSLPLVFTLMYRGVPRGTVRMQPAAFPAELGSRASREYVALSGWVEPTEDYAEVRAELAGKNREVAGLEGAGPEAIREHLFHWTELYRSNGLELLDEGGNPVTCESINVSDAGLSAEHEPGAPQVIVTALFRRTEEPWPAG
jgi:hypothetical protein